MPTKANRIGGRRGVAAQGEELTLAASLEHAVALARDYGLDVDGFFSSAGYRPERLQKSTPRVSMRVLSLFLTWAAEASGDASFGLKAGARLRPRDLGAYGYLLLNSPTLGEAMEIASRFADFPQQGGAIGWSVPPEGREFEVRYDARGMEERLRRQDAECTLAIVHAVLQSLAGRKIRPVEVRVQHGPVERGTAIGEHFGCPVSHGDAHNALRYETSLFDLPIRGADPQLLSILMRYVEQELESLPPPGDELGQVRWAIRQGMSSGRTGIAPVSRRCRMNERTLQRRLSRHGLTYSDLVDTVRQEMLAELESSRSPSQKEIAERLGFGDASAFAKAKRRWKHAAETAGQSPETGTPKGETPRT